MSVKYSSILTMVMYSRTVLQLRESGLYHSPGGTSHGRQEVEGEIRKALASSTQSYQQGKRANTSEHSNPPPKRPALYPSRRNAFRMATSMLLLVLAISFYNTFEWARANPYFRGHTANISLRHWYCSTIWLVPPKFWQSIRNVY